MSNISFVDTWTVVQLMALVFSRTEVLHHTGVLNDFPPLSKEQGEMIEDMKAHVLRRANTFRTQVRRRLGPKTIQQFFENERVGALGLASGALVGTLL